MTGQQVNVNWSKVATSLPWIIDQLTTLDIDRLLRRSDNRAMVVPGRFSWNYSKEFGLSVHC